MAGSKTLILCLLVASAFIYLGSWRNPIDVKELVLWAGRFFLVLAVLTLIISLVIPWIPSSPVSRSNSSRTVPEDEMDQHQKLVRKEQQEQLSEKASSYIEKVMKPREELKLKKQEKRFYQMTGQSWKLTDGQKLGEVEDSVNNCSNVDTGVETANNEALRKRRLPEHATKHLPKAEQPQPKKVITLPEEPQELEEGVVTVALRCPSGRVYRRRFYKSCNSLVLLDWMMKLGYHTAIYTLCTSFPRCHLAIKNDSTLEIIGIVNDTVLNVEEKDLS